MGSGYERNGKRREFVKLHMLADADSKKILAVVVTAAVQLNVV